MTATIHPYTAAPDKFFVNSFIVEGETGLVLIDTQFLLSSARDVADRITALGKPLDAVIITHPHPDHFNGLPTILDAFGPVPVYANRPTIETIAATQADKRAAWTPIYGDDYPLTDAFPDHALGSDETLTLAGIEFRLIDLGPGECADNSVIHLPGADALITSDLVYSGCHPWMAEHRIDQWLAQLDRVGAAFPTVTTVYPGHGAAGGRELLDAQRAYLDDFRDLVASHARAGALDEPAMAAIRAATINGRDGWPLDMLIEMNAAALAMEVR